MFLKINKSIDQEGIHLTLKDFIIGVKLKLISDDYGYGYFATEKGMDTSREIELGRFPFSEAQRYNTHVVWFPNK